VVAAIEFPPHERDDKRRYVVSFPAIINGKPIECAISYQALRDHCGADYDDPLPAFRAHRQRIEQLALQCIRQDRFESDGIILLRSHDIPFP
jgi:hypothetical protein